MSIQPARFEDLERNKIINRCSSDLESIINGFDPEVHNLNNMVWDRLDRMAVEIEANASLTAERDRLREALSKAEPYVEICHSLMTGTEPRKSVWTVLKLVRAALSPEGSK